MESFMYHLIHASNNTITWEVMSARGIIIFLFAIILIKVGGKRIFGKQTSIDIIIGITMGAILGKGVTGSAPFIPTLITCLVMAVLHRLLAMVTYRHEFLGRIIKGEPDLLIEHGVLKNEMLKEANISEKDLIEALRLQGVDDFKKVKSAWLERSGKISVVSFD